MDDFGMEEVFFPPLNNIKFRLSFPVRPSIDGAVIIARKTSGTTFIENERFKCASHLSFTAVK